MGTIRGIVEMNGTVFEVTYYTVNGKRVMRAKSSLDKERVMTDPRFENSRKAGREFGRASSGAKLLRDAFSMAAELSSQSYLQSTLTKKLQQLLATDTIHSKGNRTLNDADMSGLSGFEWNKDAPFAWILKRSIDFRLDGSTGEAEIRVPAFDVRTDLRPSPEATHFELMVTVAGIDFEAKKQKSVEDSTGWLPLTGKVDEQVMRGKIEMESGMKLFAGIGIRFGIATNVHINGSENKTGKAFMMA